MIKISEMLPLEILAVIVYYFPFLNSTCSDYTIDSIPNVIFNECCGYYVLPDSIPDKIPVVCTGDLCFNFTKYLFTTDCQVPMFTLISSCAFLSICVMCLLLASCCRKKGEGNTKKKIDLNEEQRQEYEYLLERKEFGKAKEFLDRLSSKKRP